MLSNAWRLFIALLLITVGVLFLLGNFGLIEIDLANLFSKLWPIIILYASLMFLIRGLWPLFTRRKVHEPYLIIGSILLLLGWNFLAKHLDLPSIDFRTLWNIFWPLLIIYIGFRILFRRSTPKYKGDWGNYSNTGNNWVGEVNIGDKPFEVEDKYYWLGVGTTDLNLTKAIFPDRETNLQVEGMIGEINIYLPPDIPVKITGQIHLGSITILGEEQSGFSKSVSYKTKGFDTATKRIVLHTNLSIGEIRVVQV